MVGGLTPLTTVDYPQHLSAVVFCQGCPWRCPYCHNRHLLPRKAETPIPWPRVREFLERRRGFLDAVVFSGGEPLMQAAIEDAVAEVKALGFGVALHTGGCDPARFARLLPMLDWVGFDVKAPFDAYRRITGAANSGSPARESLGQLLASGTAYEVRTTVDPTLLSRGDLFRLADELRRLGVGNWVLQECRSADGSPSDLSDLVTGLGEMFPGFGIRDG